MTDPLIGIQLKIDRAKQQLAQLDREIGEFIEHGEFGVIAGEYDAQRGTHVFRHRQKNPVPAMWGVIVGEVVHDARSALDHLVWHLVDDNGGKPGRHTAFPVYVARSLWNRDVEKREKKRGPGPLAGVAAKHFDAIKAFQPYNESDLPHARATSLALLQEFWNIDKHRAVHAGAGVVFGRASIRPLAPGITMTGAGLNTDRKNFLEDGTEVGWVRLRGGAPGTEVEMDNTWPVTIVFGEPGNPRANGVDLLRAVDHVEHIVSHLTSGV